MKASTFFIGLATGLAAGAAATLFTTPQSGKELRTTVKSTSSDWKERLNDVKEKVNDLKESVAALSAETKSQVPAAMDELKKSMETWQHGTMPAKEHLQLEIMAIQKSIEELQKSISKDKKDDKDKEKDSSDKKDDKDNNNDSNKG